MDQWGYSGSRSSWEEYGMRAEDYGDYMRSHRKSINRERQARFLIINGEKKNWDDIKTGTNNCFSVVVTTSKLKLSHKEANKFLYNYEKLMGSVSSAISNASFILDAGYAVGVAGHLESMKYSMVSDQIRDLNEVYDNLENPSGLNVLTKHLTRISNGEVSHSTTTTFYIPNGSAITKLTY